MSLPTQIIPWFCDSICWISYMYMCVCWSMTELGNAVLKFSIENQLHFKFFWPGLLLNKLKVSSHWDVLAESRDESQSGVDSRVPGRSRRSYFPQYSTKRIVSRILCPMLVPGLKGENRRDDENWRDFRRMNCKGILERNNNYYKYGKYTLPQGSCGSIPFRLSKGKRGITRAELRAAFEHP